MCPFDKALQNVASFCSRTLSCRYIDEQSFFFQLTFPALGSTCPESSNKEECHQGSLDSGATFLHPCDYCYQHYPANKKFMSLVVIIEAHDALRKFWIW